LAAVSAELAHISGGTLLTSANVTHTIDANLLDAQFFQLQSCLLATLPVSEFNDPGAQRDFSSKCLSEVRTRPLMATRPPGDGIVFWRAV
jgi:hypothetical protein